MTNPPHAHPHRHPRFDFEDDDEDEFKMKSPKTLWRICVTTTPAAEDAVGELLASLFGGAAAAYFDLKSRTSRVSIFLETGKFSTDAAREKIFAGLARVKSFGLDTGAAKIEIAKMKREDWAESWKRHFKPIEIRVRRDELHESPAKKHTTGTRRARPSEKSLLVKPSWSKKPAAKNQAVVILDPGLSFGTGQHPTTEFCLREIVAARRRGAAAKSFLDIGTGSGILAMAAAKLGYAPVCAFDFDAESVRVAGENARKNRVADRIKLSRGDVTRLPLRAVEKFDLVCANLISDLLIAERKRIANRVARGGRLVLAGILRTEFLAVQRAYAELGLELVRGKIGNEWRSGAFCFV
jgi:ribosomal protein L11 methyltransferase